MRVCVSHIEWFLIKLKTIILRLSFLVQQNTARIFLGVPDFQTAERFVDWPIRASGIAIGSGQGYTQFKRGFFYMAQVKVCFPSNANWNVMKIKVCSAGRMLAYYNKILFLDQVTLSQVALSLRLDHHDIRIGDRLHCSEHSAEQLEMVLLSFRVQVLRLISWECTQTIVCMHLELHMRG